jgi:hypothetical protein
MSITMPTPAHSLSGRHNNMKTMKKRRTMRDYESKPQAGVPAPPGIR